MDPQDTTDEHANEQGDGKPRSRRGFAAMDPQRQREIASLGGRAVHRSGNAHRFTTEEARAAGRKRHQRIGPTAQG